VNDSKILPPIVLAKIDDQIDRAQHLIALVPPDSLEWHPTEDVFRVCDLLGHLLECFAGVCACLYALYPESLSHFQALKELPVNHCCGVDEARERIAEYSTRIFEGFRLLTDDDLGRLLPTAFNPRGEPAIGILLGNLEHIINHKNQLFLYLKMLGVTVGTQDLYKFRGPVS
jgi:hypothetical protein